MTQKVSFLTKGEMLDAIKAHLNMSKNAEFARFLGISSQAVSNWYSRNTFDAELLYTKCDFISPDWLLTGRGSMLRENQQPENEPEPVKSPQIQILHHPKVSEKKITQQSIPLYDVSVAANLKTVFDNKDQNILGEISMPDIPRCDGAVYVRGDSMYPLLKSGDIVGYKEIHDFSNVIYGEMYIVAYDIEGDEYVCVKYINRSEQDGCVKLVSYNPHHDPKDIQVTRITAMALVKFSIRMNTII